MLPQCAWLAGEKKKTDALEVTHKAARRQLAQDHRAAMDAAIAKHPID
jgi:hypothetical protein